MASVKSIAFGLVFLASTLWSQVPIANGGTGATTVPGAQTNLGIPPAIPSGMIAFIATGTCPSGWTENDALAGYNVLVTTSAAGDVGTHANQSLTAAAQTVNSLTAAAQTFTGSSTSVPAETVYSLTAAAQAFTGASDTTSAVSGGTPAGSNSGGGFTEGAISWPVGVPTNAGGAFTEGAIAWPTGGSSVPTFAGASDTTSSTGAGTPAGTNSATATSGNCAATNIAAGSGSTTACKATAPNLTVPAETFAGSALAGHTHTVTPTGTVAWPTPVPTIAGGTFTQPTISWPAGVPTIAAGTFTQPTFAGSSLATHTHTVTPTGSNGTSAVTGTLNGTTITPLGTNSSSAVTGTLNGTTITPLGSNSTSAVTGSMNSSAVSGNTAYYKVIACKKN